MNVEIKAVFFLNSVRSRRKQMRGGSKEKEWVLHPFMMLLLDLVLWGISLAREEEENWEGRGGSKEKINPSPPHAHTPLPFSYV